MESECSKVWNAPEEPMPPGGGPRKRWIEDDGENVVAEGVAEGSFVVWWFGAREDYFSFATGCEPDAVAGGSLPFVERPKDARFCTFR